VNYYEQLYDINFFSNESYVASVNYASVEIKNPGIPDWDTWQSKALIGKKAKRLWDDFSENKEDYFRSQLFRDLHFEEERLLLVLILCEKAYRDKDLNSFFLLIRILISSGIEELILKAIKLQYAWFVLSYLSHGATPAIEMILDHGINFFQNKLKMRDITKDVFKVEVPVKLDWEAQHVSPYIREAVENFYISTHSYIPELIAANHQVETLFNYGLICDLLKRLGVETIIDYGAGIGTFLMTAHNYGIRGIYADLRSTTMQYAQHRFKSYKVKIPVLELDPKEFKLPNNLDCIVCTEVLEHIFEPEELIRTFYDALRPQGILVVSESFDYVENFCSHLPQHKGKGGDVFLNLLSSSGFKQILVGFTIHPTVHIKT
jgi:2-polyprenyl-3-methyl-5-hydroxy-6-metoxy-1,4-benzoquinol methylase